MTSRPVLQPDAHHPISITPTDGRVVVTRGEQVVADTRRALTLDEAGYQPVQYVPLDDVDPAVLAASEHTTYCPYKGDAAYYSLDVEGDTLADVVWTYPEPHAAVADIAGHVAFYSDRIDVRVSVA